MKRPGVRRVIAVVGISVFILAAGAGALWRWRAARHRRQAPASPRLSEPARRELVRHFRNALESAGGSQVWVKWPRAAEFAPAGADEAIKAVAASEAYPAIVTALRDQAAKDGAQCRVEEKRGAAGWRLADIRLTRGRDRICRWRVREVPRLLHASIVIDDLGQDLPTAHRLLTLPYPLTFSVLPHLRYSTETAEIAARAGREVMLHWPMQAEPGPHPAPGDGEIRPGMSAEDIRRILAADLRSVPHAAGANNHMGSLATANAPLMREVMQALADHHLYFVDSRTTAQTVALDAARRQGLPAFYRSVFLDDTESVAYTLGQLQRFRRVVKEQGAALAIGHPHATTLAALARFLPELEKDDIELVPPSRLVRLPEVARLSPPRRPGS